jgi:hypothetical protein
MGLFPESPSSARLVIRYGIAIGLVAAVTAVRFLLDPGLEITLR